MIGHGTGESVGKVGVLWVESQERNHGSKKVFNVFGLSFVPASGVSLFAFSIALPWSQTWLLTRRLPLGDQFLPTNPQTRSFSLFIFFSRPKPPR